jgi:hypothetical protein
VPVNDSNEQNKGSGAPYVIKKAKKDTCYHCGKAGHFSLIALLSCVTTVNW